MAELFEARRPKDFAVISEGEGRVEFGNDYKAKRRVRVVPTEVISMQLNICCRKVARWPLMKGTWFVRVICYWMAVQFRTTF